MEKGNEMPAKFKLVQLAEMPKCDFCSEEASFDGKTQMGPWAYTCEAHFFIMCYPNTEGLAFRLEQG